MNISKDMYGNSILTFTSNLNVDNGYSNESMGDHESIMTLYLDAFGFPQGIEWDNPIDVTYIGIEYDEIDRVVTGYDGVFELPSQAIYLLVECGFKVDI